MINSLKRKKPSTGTRRKQTAAKGTGRSLKVARPPAKTSVGETLLTSHGQSLDHLIDRPYFEYDSQRDDISIASLCIEELITVFQVLNCEDASKDKMALHGISIPLVDEKPSPLVRPSIPVQIRGRLAGMVPWASGKSM